MLIRSSNACPFTRTSTWIFAKISLADISIAGAICWLCYWLISRTKLRHPGKGPCLCSTYVDCVYNTYEVKFHWYIKHVFWLGHVLHHRINKCEWSRFLNFLKCTNCTMTVPGSKGFITITSSFLTWNSLISCI